MPRLFSFYLFRCRRGQYFVSATPSREFGYDGCLIIPIMDQVNAKIARDSNNAPFIHRFLRPAVIKDVASFSSAIMSHLQDSNRFSGACTYFERSAQASSSLGYLLPTLFPEDSPRFFN